MEMLGETRVTRADGTLIAWSELGQGEPLVLLHGLGDSHRTWRRVAPLLANRFRVIMPDLPGHGLSGRPDAPYTLDWYAHTMRCFFDAIDLPRAHVIGHSFGGGVAQWLVLDARERVDRLVLVAPGGLGREVSLGLRVASFPVLAPLLAPRLMGPMTHVMMRSGVGELVKHEDDEIARIAWMNCAPGSARAFVRTVSGCMNLLGQTMQSWDRIHEVPELPPMGLIWGARDNILPIKHALQAVERIEGAMFARYALSGHFPHLEESGRFVDDVWRFLGSEPSRPRVRPMVVRARPMGRVKRFFVRLGSGLRGLFRPQRAATGTTPRPC